MSAVDRILGVPFRRHGRELAGLDCYGVVLWLARRWGIAVPDLTEIVQAAADPTAIDAATLPLPAGLREVPLREARRGDVAWLRDERGRTNHVEIVESPGLSVTALYRVGVTRVRWTPEWRQRLHTIWRCPCSA